MQKKYITLERLQRLHENIGILFEWKNKEGEDLHIGPNINTINVTETKLLNELGEINKRRDRIIEVLINNKKEI